MQQKEFDADKTAVFGSVVDVLQDLGFTIDSADLATGLITAESATVNKTSFWDALGEAAGSGNTRATAFIETMPDKLTRVRLNFLATKTTSGLYGQGAREDTPILDERLYERMFARIDQAVIVRTQGAPGAPEASQVAQNLTPIAPIGPPVSVKSTLAPAALLAAAKHELEAEGFTVLKYDEASGLLVTGPMPVHLTSALADCGKEFGFSYIDDKRASTDVQYFVDVANGAINARLAIDGMYRPGYGHPDKTLQCTSRGGVETTFLGKIVQP
jgi:hypothetical protein